MFWNKFVLLCSRREISPNEVCRKLGFSNATSTKWKNGATPRDTTLTKIAEYFGITVDFLKPDVASEGITLTEHETELILAYRRNPEMQYAVDKLLGISTMKVYMAANSSENRPDRIIEMDKKRWSELKNAPETDETLL